MREQTDGERELVIARWGMPGPPQFGGASITNIRNVKSPQWRRWLGKGSRCVGGREPGMVLTHRPAASFLRGATARMLLKETVPLHLGDTVLFHAAAGGVGLLFAQWARAVGIRVIGTVSDDAKVAVARHAGCVEVINYDRQDFVERVRAITNGEGVAAVFDAFGRDMFLKSLETLRPRGVLAAFGKASGDPPALDPFLLAPKSLYVTWPIRPIYTASRQQLEASAADVFDAIGHLFSTSAQTAPTPSTISFRPIAIWRAERSSALPSSVPERLSVNRASRGFAPRRRDQDCDRARREAAQERVGPARQNDRHARPEHNPGGVRIGEE